MKSLLVLTDFSANATHAAEYAWHLGNQAACNLLLCNAISTPAEMPQMDYVLWPMEDEDDLKNASHLQLMELKNRLACLHQQGFNPAINTINYLGSPIDVFSSTGLRDRSEIMVLGTHNNGVFKTLFLGNHCQDMIGHSTQPLLIVPPSAPRLPVRRIAFATDLTDTEADLTHIFQLIVLAKALKADILITHIADGELSAQCTQAHEKLIKEISNKANYPHIYYKILNHADPKKGLKWICSHEHIDILSVSPQKHGATERFIKGSLTRYIAKHLPLPLLVFPAN